MCITHVLQSRCKTFQEKVFHSRKVELFVAFRGLCFCQEPSKINDESPQHAAILSLQSQGPKGLQWGSAGMAGTRKIEATNLHQRPVFFRWTGVCYNTLVTSTSGASKCCKVILPKVPWEESHQRGMEFGERQKKWEFFVSLPNQQLISIVYDQLFITPVLSNDEFLVFIIPKQHFIYLFIHTYVRTYARTYVHTYLHNITLHNITLHNIT